MATQPTRDPRGTDGAARWGADEAVTALYAAHYARLVHLAALLLHDRDAAEEVVQDAFVAMHQGWGRLRDPDKALAYLRQAVVNRSRSSLRRRRTAEHYVPDPVPTVASAETTALGALGSRAVMDALRALPRRQREVLVLRYFLDLSEADIAAAMRVSRGSVKSHASRGMTTLRATLETS